MGVVVHRVELEHLFELHPGGIDLLGAEVGPGQRLADRALLRLELAGALQGDHGGVHVAGVEQPAALLKADVGLAVRLAPSGPVLSRRRDLLENPPWCPTSSPFPASATELARSDIDLGAVTAPPYDVIDDEGRTRLEAAHPQNAVRLILPRDVESGDRYRRARETFDEWQAEGVLAADAPHLYVYRMGFTDEAGRPRRMTGVVGALELSPPGEDVLPHERTMGKAKSDRLDLLRSVRANLDPIWMLSAASGLSELLEPALTRRRPRRLLRRRGRRRALPVPDRGRPRRPRPGEDRHRAVDHRRRPSPLRDRPRLPGRTAGRRCGRSGRGRGSWRSWSNWPRTSCSSSRSTA